MRTKDRETAEPGLLAESGIEKEKGCAEACVVTAQKSGIPNVK